MSILSVENVTHMYGDKINFQHITFRLLRGEHVGLVGDNGAGKSTLLRILAGELLPDEGKISWFPHVKVGFLQQQYDLKHGTTIKQYLKGAFTHLYEIEKNIQQITEKMTAADDHLEQFITQYGEWQSMLDHASFYHIDVRIEAVAAGLGIMDIGMNRDVASLSGGQRTKLLLAKLLLEEPDVLLLDEPTNYLDDVHIQWLVNYLKNYEHAFIVVSHDEMFLNETTTVIYHLAHQTIKRYTGNYQSFKKSYEQSKHQLQLAYEKQQKEIQKLETFIEKNRVRKAKQAKSREKALGKIERVEKPASAVRPRFTFHVHGQAANKILEAKDLQIGYTEPLFAPVHLQINSGEKIALVGYNGIGKSTMLKTLLGLIQPLKGQVRLGEGVKTAYFAQEDAVSEQTPLDRLWSFCPELTQKEIRRMLAYSGLKEEHMRKSICTLSGGEQAKVRLCQLMLTESNVLVLDEPTNHLDIHTKEALKEALMNYSGTILLVSHEPAFYEDWVTQVWQVEDWC